MKLLQRQYLECAHGLMPRSNGASILNGIDTLKAGYVRVWRCREEMCERGMSGYGGSREINRVV